MTMILALIAASAVLVAIPGPNVALIVANTLRYGFRFGAVTVLGTTSGVALQLGFVVAGLAMILDMAASAMVWIKWAGVVYLIYLGVQTWRAPADDLSDISASTSPVGRVFLQGLGFAIINPKTLMFNAAFLPQFLGPDVTTSTLIAASSVYLAVFLLGDLLWVFCAHWVKPILSNAAALRNKITGSFFIGAGFGLALVRIDR